MVMFRVYYFGLAPYENAPHFLGLSERSWVTGRKKSTAAAERNCCVAACSPRESIFAAEASGRAGRRNVAPMRRARFRNVVTAD